LTAAEMPRRFRTSHQALVHHDATNGDFPGAVVSSRHEKRTFDTGGVPLSRNGQGLHLF
jgi:hypothetical protein